MLEFVWRSLCVAVTLSLLKLLPSPDRVNTAGVAGEAHAAGFPTEAAQDLADRRRDARIVLAVGVDQEGALEQLVEGENEGVVTLAQPVRVGDFFLLAQPFLDD